MFYRSGSLEKAVVLWETLPLQLTESRFDNYLPYGNRTVVFYLDRRLKRKIWKN